MRGQVKPDPDPRYELVDGVLLGPRGADGERIRLDPETRMPLSLVRLMCAARCGWYGWRFERHARAPCPMCRATAVPAWE